MPSSFPNHRESPRSRRVTPVRIAGPARPIAVSILLVCACLSDFAVAQRTVPSVLVGAGDIGNRYSHSDERTGQLLDGIPGTVFTLGDNAYPTGTDIDFARCYDPAWGRQRARTRPAPGNHDYDYGNGGYHRYFGAAAGSPGKGYYNYDRPGRHIVALNSNLRSAAALEEGDWLQNDLVRHRSRCLLAYWHHPLFSSGIHHHPPAIVSKFWHVLAAHGAEVVMNGHDHIYEHFAPQTPQGEPDPAGIREFIVGTGGAPLYRIETVAANSEVRNVTSHGVLELRLYPTRYEWEFVGTASTQFHDTGAGTCSPAS